MPQVNDRLLQFLNENELKPRQVSLAIGKHGGYLSNAFNANSSISADVISQICEMYPELDANWLLTGKVKEDSPIHTLEESEEIYSNKNTIDKMIENKIDKRLIELKREWRDFLEEQVKKTNNGPRNKK